MLRFLELDGLDLVLDLLRRMDYVTRNSDTHTSIIGCVKALMNSAVSDVTIAENDVMLTCLFTSCSAVASTCWSTLTVLTS